MYRPNHEMDVWAFCVNMKMVPSTLNIKYHFPVLSLLTVIDSWYLTLDVSLIEFTVHSGSIPCSFTVGDIFLYYD